MSSFAVVLDADVLFPAPIRDALLGAAERALYRALWSDEILEEVRRNLVKRQRASEAQARHLLDEIRGAFPEAVVTGYQELIPVMRNDPEDRHVLAAAVRANAEVIVTRNIKHVPPDALAPYEIEAQTPDEFLLNLLGLAPNVMIQVVVEQARTLRKPPRTVYDVLDAIGWHAPTAAQTMRDLLARPTEERRHPLRYVPRARRGA